MRKTFHTAVTTLAIFGLLAGCSKTEPPGDSTAPPGTPTSQAAAVSTAAASTGSQTTVKLLTHDSFAVPDGLFDKFTEQTGLTVEVLSSGGAGELTNQLILTKDHPLGDVAFGIDNGLAARAVQAGVFTEPASPIVTPPAQAELSQQFAEDAAKLVAMDTSDVCVNYDKNHFSGTGQKVPETFADLTALASSLVVENPATSSPGLAFLLATIAAQPDSWQNYWKDLVAGGVKVAQSWTDAYEVDFSGPSSQGDRPLVVSYASSPASEIPDGSTEPATGALLGTCFRQVEYAGVLSGTTNPQGAAQLLEFLASTTFQDTVADYMWVYPANPDAAIPDNWRDFAPLASQPWTLDPADIAAHRDEWIDQWTEIVSTN
ncbi:MAG: thiamine ABC transporter substrate-binding protein [Bifidobacteriaceae bacterium]|jgi:thiamine transport system substrate-binding protein|nr:thiamine ABC transporter substrate-binding protein [Bifidobacteriaceae bacterium]